MSRYFAKIDSSNIVERVVVAENAEWCEVNLGGNWVETFMDDEHVYAGVGYTYDPNINDFVAPVAE